MRNTTDIQSLLGCSKPSILHHRSPD